MGRIGWILLAGVGIFIVALAVYSSNKDTDSKEVTSVWNEKMVQGDKEADNTIINFTDVTCPHCANFHNTISDSTFEKDYINSGRLRMEMRVTSLLINNNSARANESAYCAADQGKDEFWNYYDEIVGKFTDDYFSKGIGVSQTSPKIPTLEDDYYYDAARNSGLDFEAMKSCMSEGDMSKEVENATQRAVRSGVMGVPFFDINNGQYSGSGFGGDYSTVKQMLQAGGVY